MQLCKRSSLLHINVSGMLVSYVVYICLALLSWNPLFTDPFGHPFPYHMARYFCGDMLGFVNACPLNSLIQPKYRDSDLGQLLSLSVPHCGLTGLMTGV